MPAKKGQPPEPREGQEHQGVKDQQQEQEERKETTMPAKLGQPPLEQDDKKSGHAKKEAKVSTARKKPAPEQPSRNDLVWPTLTEKIELDRPWEENFARLEKFKEENHHCIVLPCTTDDYKLVRWAHQQRFLEAFKAIPADRLEKLNGLDNFFLGVDDGLYKWFIMLERMRREGFHVVRSHKWALNEWWANVKDRFEKGKGKWERKGDKEKIKALTFLRALKTIKPLPPKPARKIPKTQKTPTIKDRTDAGMVGLPQVKNMAPYIPPLPCNALDPFDPVHPDVAAEECMTAFNPFYPLFPVGRKLEAQALQIVRDVNARDQDGSSATSINNACPSADSPNNGGDSGVVSACATNSPVQNAGPSADSPSDRGGSSVCPPQNNIGQDAGIPCNGFAPPQQQRPRTVAPDDEGGSGVDSANNMGQDVGATCGGGDDDDDDDDDDDNASGSTETHWSDKIDLCVILGLEWHPNTFVFYGFVDKEQGEENLEKLRLLKVEEDLPVALCKCDPALFCKLYYQRANVLAGKLDAWIRKALDDSKSDTEAAAPVDSDGNDDLEVADTGLDTATTNNNKAPAPAASAAESAKKATSARPSNEQPSNEHPSNAKRNPSSKDIVAPTANDAESRMLFSMYFPQLQDFSRENGNCKVSWLEPKLCKWVKHQKASKDTLRQKEQRLLEGLPGWVWDLSTTTPGGGAVAAPPPQPPALDATDNNDKTHGRGTGNSEARELATANQRMEATGNSGSHHHDSSNGSDEGDHCGGDKEEAHPVVTAAAAEHGTSDDTNQSNHASIQGQSVRILTLESQQDRELALKIQKLQRESHMPEAEFDKLRAKRVHNEAGGKDEERPAKKRSVVPSSKHPKESPRHNNVDKQRRSSTRGVLARPAQNPNMSPRNNDRGKEKKSSAKRTAALVHSQRHTSSSEKRERPAKKPKSSTHPSVPVPDEAPSAAPSVCPREKSNLDACPDEAPSSAVVELNWKIMHSTAMDSVKEQHRNFVCHQKLFQLQAYTAKHFFLQDKERCDDSEEALAEIKIAPLSANLFLLGPPFDSEDALKPSYQIMLGKSAELIGSLGPFERQIDHWYCMHVVRLNKGLQYLKGKIEGTKNLIMAVNGTPDRPLPVLDGIASAAEPPKPTTTEVEANPGPCHQPETDSGWKASHRQLQKNKIMLLIRLNDVRKKIKRRHDRLRGWHEEFKKLEAEVKERS